MRKLLLSVMIAATMTATAQIKQQNSKEMNRIEATKETYHQLFGGEALTGTGTDPELMNILQKFIFGDVFHTGVLDNQKRELITLVTLTTLQTLPQLKAHTVAALNVGVNPSEIREAVYQCAPYIGYPKTLNALGIINEVFKERGIQLPLENQGTVTEENRSEKGKAIQDALYGDEIKKMMSTLPGNFNEIVPRLLTEHNFGDYYTRGVLDVKTRELLMYCVVATLGAEFQLNAHAKGALKAGNTKEELVAAMVQCIGYIGFPYAINAINSIQNN
ncbi:MAG: carboxymuconolactone decarboxylase family protein [Saprospiraceae bacterium]|nr:MAG: carboxymuconolactone decarboxylase family protein [Saprospiraceae bacterium]